jgi:5-methylcytosine-specific restriction protein A
MAEQSWRGEKGSANARGYTYRWQKAREQYLRLHPLCVMCQQQNRLTPATVVDHKVPHRGDQVLFWSEDNWQSLCKTHHDGAKHSEEMTGRVRGCDASGQPLDPNHHWNK